MGTDSGRSRIGCGVLGLGRRRGDVEQLAGESEVVGLHAARQQTVVADAMEALRQHVYQEPANEDVGIAGGGVQLRMAKRS